MRGFQPSRRRFLSGLFAWGALAWFPARPAASDVRSAIFGGQAALVGDLIRSKRSARAVARAAGIACSRRHAAELHRALLDRVGAGEDASPAALSRAFRNRMCRDFERGDVIRVRGWYLSRTEVVLAALVAALD